MKNSKMTRFLSIAVLLGCLIHGNSADGKLPFIVKTVYFRPADAPPAPNTIGALMKEAQAFYASEMARHGFEPKTFRLETDAQGTVMVHKRNGKRQTWEYLNATSHKVAQEMPAQFKDPNTVYVFIVGGLQLVENHACGIGTSITGAFCGGNAFVPGSGHCLNVKTIAHELGHTFGLWHELANTHALMFSPAGPELQYFECRWLDKQHYFNNLHQINGVPRVTKTHPIVASEENTNEVKFRVEVASINPLHQLQLFRAGDNGVLGWSKLSGRSDTAIIAARRTWLKGYTQVAFQVLDTQGNHLMHYIHFRLPDPNVMLTQEPIKPTIPAKPMKPDKPPDTKMDEPDTPDPLTEDLTVSSKSKLLLLWAAMKRE